MIYKKNSKYGAIRKHADSDIQLSPWPWRADCDRGVARLSEFIDFGIYQFLEFIDFYELYRFSSEGLRHLLKCLKHSNTQIYTYSA